MKKLLKYTLVLLLCSIALSEDKSVKPVYINDNSLFPVISEGLYQPFTKYIEIKEEFDSMVKQERLRREEEARIAAEEEARLSAHVNFDEVFNYIDVGGGECQSWIDADYVTRYYNDYYHHNTQKFLNLFFRLRVGSEVTIGGNTYTCTGTTTGQLNDSSTAIYLADGSAVADQSDAVEIITCMNNTGGRYIAFLE